MAVNRPFKDGLLLKGAYTFSKALNETDDDGWVGLTWNQPSQLAPQLRAGRLRSPAHAADGVRLRAAVRAETARMWSAYVVKNWQVSGIASWMSGRPFTIAGDNGLLQQVGGQQTINVTGDAKPGFGAAGPNEQWYDPSIFSQPGNAWGNTGRNAFRAPSNYNLDASLFRTIPIGHTRVEIRVESQNVLNHPQWGIPVTGFTDPNFMRIRAFDNNRVPRTVQLGVRFAF